MTTDYHMIGWAPRYLVNDLDAAMAHAPGDCQALVVKVNPVPAPSTQRVLRITNRCQQNSFSY